MDGGVDDDDGVGGAAVFKNTLNFRLQCSVCGDQMCVCQQESGGLHAGGGMTRCAPTLLFHRQ